MTPIDRVPEALIDADKRPSRTGNGWSARCPAHDDRRPSLSLATGDDGRALLHCHAGCTPEQVVSSLGLTMQDLMPNGDGQASKPKTPAIYATAEAAIAELERQHGKAAGRWIYRDANDAPVGVVLRFDRRNGKTFRPVSRTGGGWVLQGMSTPRPLYRLGSLAGAETVVIVEGEKCADVLCELGIIATTSPHGSNAASKADWSPLAGEQVVLWPDHDTPGRRYAADVLACLATLSARPTVRQVEPGHLGLREHEDVADYLHGFPADCDPIERRAALQDALANAEPVALPEPVPAEPVATPAPIPAYRGFPVGLLPEPLCDVVQDGAKALVADSAYLAVPLLCVVGSAIGNCVRLAVKRTWQEVPCLWAAIVGASDTMTIPALRLILKPLRELQTESFKDYATRADRYKAERLRYEKTLAMWKRDRQSQSDPPKKPTPPACRRFIVTDTTLKALGPILLANWQGLLMARDELNTWFHRLTWYKSDRGNEAQAWFRMFSGKSVTIDRRTGHPPTLYIPSALVSVCGGIQRGTLEAAMTEQYREAGLLARLLLCEPPRREKVWTEAELPQGTEWAYRDLLTRLAQAEPTHDAKGKPTPRLIHLGPDAKRAWVVFYNAHNVEQKNLDSDLSRAWSKLEGYTLRFALIFHMVKTVTGETADPNVIDLATMQAAIKLTRWWCYETRRVYARLDQTEEDRERNTLVRWIRQRGGKVTVRDVQRGWRKLRGSAELAAGALSELAAASLGKWQNVAPGPKGGHPTRAFVLTDPPGNTTPVFDSASGVVLPLTHNDIRKTTLSPDDGPPDGDPG